MSVAGSVSTLLDLDVSRMDSNSRQFVIGMFISCFLSAD